MFNVAGLTEIAEDVPVTVLEEAGLNKMVNECPCVSGLTGISEDVPVTVSEALFLAAELHNCARLTEDSPTFFVYYSW